MSIHAPVNAEDEPLEEFVNRGDVFLTSYQDSIYGQRYRKLVERVANAETTIGGTRDNLTRTVARVYWKLLAYKDEYEVARLFVSNELPGKSQPRHLNPVIDFGFIWHLLFFQRSIR